MNFNKPNRAVNCIHLHCSATDHDHHDDVSVMREWHTSPPRNWSDVGYHFFIKKDGTIQEGRPLERTPASIAGHNSGAIAICMHGLLESKFTDAQYFALQDLCVEINHQYDGIMFVGHRELDPGKACPVYDYRSVLGLDEHGYMVYDMVLPPVDGSPFYEDHPIGGAKPVLKLTARGRMVEVLQNALGITPDGIFGRDTEESVKAFQYNNGLSADGVVGSRTWSALGL